MQRNAWLAPPLQCIAPLLLYSLSSLDFLSTHIGPSLLTLDVYTKLEWIFAPISYKSTSPTCRFNNTSSLWILYSLSICQLRQSNLAFMGGTWQSSFSLRKTTGIHVTGTTVHHISEWSKRHMNRKRCAMQGGPVRIFKRNLPSLRHRMETQQNPSSMASKKFWVQWLRNSFHIIYFNEGSPGHRTHKRWALPEGKSVCISYLHFFFIFNFSTAYLICKITTCMIEFF